MKIQEAIVEQLREHHLTIATAESCTGGMVAATLVDVSGVSECFAEGYVTYSNDIKHKNLGVSQKTLDTIGAVSRETAVQMAAGVRRKAHADISIATTGYAGPLAGDDGIPVGRVYVSCSYGNRIITRQYSIHGNRCQVRRRATRYALELLWDCLMVIS